MHLAQDRDQCSYEQGNDPSGSIKGGEFLDILFKKLCSIELVN
jgi:hypothetical protein